MSTTTSGFTLTRHVAATTEQIHRSWTDEQEMRWFAAGTGPDQDQPVSIELQIGGQWRMLMVEDAEKSYYTGGVYRTIEPNRVAFFWGAVGGWPPVDLSDLDNGPLVTVDWEQQGAGCEVTLQLTVNESVPDELREQVTCDICRDSWGITLSRLVDKYAV